MSIHQTPKPQHRIFEMVGYKHKAIVDLDARFAPNFYADPEAPVMRGIKMVIMRKVDDDWWEEVENNFHHNAKLSDIIDRWEKYITPALVTTQSKDGQ